MTSGVEVAEGNCKVTKSIRNFTKTNPKSYLAMKVSATLACVGLLVGLAIATLFPYEPRNPLSGTLSPPGTPWPLPRTQSSTTTLLTFNPASFSFSSDLAGNCPPLDFALEKYNKEFLFPVFDEINPIPDPIFTTIPKVDVKIMGDNGGQTECNNHPRLSDDPSYEHYKLVVEENGDALIEAETVWGALRGIDTFSQLIFSNELYESGPFHFYMNATTIDDAPRFPHRGLSVDTARHYQPEKMLYHLLDAMMYNKLNVFHWHIIDDQSFPYVSKRFPELSQKAAYSYKHIYTPEAVQRVIEAAKLRAIRVVLEFDTPGHTQAFGVAFPELLTPCYGKPGEPGTPNYPLHAAYENLDPTKEFTYEFMREFFTEVVQNVSADQFVHLGMDEAYPECWLSSPEIAEFMKVNGYTNVSQVQEHYTTRHVEMVKSLGAMPISWQDPLDAGVKLDKDVIIQVWKDWGLTWQDHFQTVLDQGYKSLLSSPWYINYISYGESWRSYYEADPILSLPRITEEQKKLVLGGEACLFAEFVDKTNILPRLFPWVSAVAERLWSSGIDISTDATNYARNRLDQHRCRMLQRGIPAQPVLNGYCGPWETEM